MLGVAKKYRDLKIPVDNIVQGLVLVESHGRTGIHKNYPDPKGMIDDLHKLDFTSCFRSGRSSIRARPVYDDMDKKGFLVDKTQVGGIPSERNGALRCVQSEARKYYWNLINTGLFQLGADAWWLVTDEPETEAGKHRS